MSEPRPVEIYFFLFLFGAIGKWVEKKYKKSLSIIRINPVSFVSWTSFSRAPLHITFHRVQLKNKRNGRERPFSSERKYNSQRQHNPFNISLECHWETKQKLGRPKCQSPPSNVDEYVYGVRSLLACMFARVFFFYFH